MPRSERTHLLAPLEAFERVLADRIEHGEARFAIRKLSWPHQTLVAERRQAVQRVKILVILRNADSFGSLDGPATNKDRQACEELLLSVRKKVVAPVDGRPQRLMPFVVVAGTARQHAERVAQPLEQRLRRGELATRRRQFYRQRQPVEAGADLSHRGRVRVGYLEVRFNPPGALDEELHCCVLRQARDGGQGTPGRQEVGHGERRDRILMLVGEVQHDAAGH